MYRVVRRILVVTAASIAGLGLVRQPEPPALDLQALRDDYSRGAYPEISETLRTHFRRLPILEARRELAANRLDEYRAVGTTSPIDHFVRDFGRGIRSWPAKSAATFGLEAAEAAAPVDPLGAAELIELVCAGLRGRDRQTWELDWHRAVIAWLQGPLLSRHGGDAPNADWAGSRPGLVEHVEHALTRFPNHPEFVLAKGIVLERQVHRYLSGRRLLLLSPRRPKLAPMPVPGTVIPRTYDGDFIGRGPYEQWARDAERAYVAVLKSSDRSRFVNAALHLGFIEDRFYGRSERALELWSQVRKQATADDDRYLALLFTGRLLGEQGRAQEAALILQAALELRPHAQSARTLLATVLLVNDQRALAADVVRDLFSLTVTTDDDPWWSYLSGDHRSWRLRLERLRLSSS